ncbi:hypothetical protein [Tautonia plasticadhaerens]|uniref:Uncharacterized protein n=1 Tax=Tautonia plasticadhaerens TaxID=2527974 RepID=A0A518HCK0_9BACT|nr:hypothetical protein [Tautonia plasticadhaerens]QDV38588.1 hypothetical protein ElP_65430 [Tautonia plasticadhaerens]
MSGPIVRKYGFPNFDKIFGPKPVMHGANDESPGAEDGKARVEAPAVEEQRARGEDSGGGGGTAR